MMNEFLIATVFGVFALAAFWGMLAAVYRRRAAINGDPPQEAKPNLPTFSPMTVSRGEDDTDRLATKGIEPLVDSSDDEAASKSALDLILEKPSLKTLVDGMRLIPTLPTIYSDIIQEMRKAEPSIAKMGEVISMDLGMTAKILQVVNSPFFGVPVPVTSPVQATMLLGFDAVKALVLSIAVFSRFDKLAFPGFSTQMLWDHSIRVGQWATRIAETEGLDKPAVEAAFTAGLLHDVGTLVFVVNRTKRYQHIITQIRRHQVPVIEAERGEFGASHAEVGAFLAHKWGLKSPIVEAIAFHHDPLRSGNQGMSPLTAVYVANLLDREQHVAEEELGESISDLGYLESIGLADRKAAWQDRCQAA